MAHEVIKETERDNYDRIFDAISRRMYAIEVMTVFIWLAGLVMAVLIFFVNPFTMLITAPIVGTMYFISEHMADKVNWTK